MENNNFVNLVINLYEDTKVDNMRKLEKKLDKGDDLKQDESSASKEYSSKNEKPDLDNSKDEALNSKNIGSNENPNDKDEPEYPTEELDDGLDNIDLNPPQDDFSQSSENDNIKSLRVFDFLVGLLDNLDRLKDRLETVDQGLIDAVDSEKLEIYKQKTEALIEKIKSYIDLKFSSESYEKNLYFYVLTRTNFVLILKKIRSLFKLGTQNDEILEKNDKK